MGGKINSYDGTVTKQDVIEKGKVHRYGDHVCSDKFKDGCTHDFKVATSKVKALDDISRYDFRVVKVYLPDNASAQELQGSGVDTYVEKGKTISKRFVLLATNIPADVADAEQIAQLIEQDGASKLVLEFIKDSVVLRRP